jgi:predicted nucleic acid-binding protein
MSAECFLDTNILVYAVSAHPDDVDKKAKAAQLIKMTDFGLSTQVFQEFYVTVTRKIAKPMPPVSAIEFLNELRLFPSVGIDYALVLEGIQASLRYQVSYWDGAILAAATSLGCGILYSEDFNHGQFYGAVQALNPFVAD